HRRGRRALRGPAPAARLVRPDRKWIDPPWRTAAGVARHGSVTDNTSASCRVPETSTDGSVRRGPAHARVSNAVCPRHALLARPPRPGPDAPLQVDPQAPGPAVRAHVSRRGPATPQDVGRLGRGRAPHPLLRLDRNALRRSAAERGAGAGG